LQTCPFPDLPSAYVRGWIGRKSAVARREEKQIEKINYAQAKGEIGGEGGGVVARGGGEGKGRN